MIYSGMSKLKIYKDIGCTRELDVDLNGKYYITVQCISGQPTHEFQKILYIKNVGTHKAYNIALEGSEANIEISQTELKPKRVAYIKVKSTITKGDKESKIYLTNISYTHLP